MLQLGMKVTTQLKFAQFLHRHSANQQAVFYPEVTVVVNTTSRRLGL